MSRQALQGAVGEMVKRGLRKEFKDWSSETVEDMRAVRAFARTKLAESGALRKAGQTGAKRGLSGGAFAVEGSLGTGSAAGELYDPENLGTQGEPSVGEAWGAVATGAGYGIIGVGSEAYLVSRLLKYAKPAVSKAKDRNLINTIVGGALAGGARASLVEGGTEAAQELLGLGFREATDPGHWDREGADPYMRLGEAAFVGALGSFLPGAGGGLFAGGARGVGRLAKRAGGDPEAEGRPGRSASGTASPQGRARRGHTRAGARDRTGQRPQGRRQARHADGPDDAGQLPPARRRLHVGRPARGFARRGHGFRRRGPRFRRPSHLLLRRGDVAGGRYAAGSPGVRVALDEPQARRGHRRGGEARAGGHQGVLAAFKGGEVESDLVTRIALDQAPAPEEGAEADVVVALDAAGNMVHEEAVAPETSADRKVAVERQYPGLEVVVERPRDADLRRERKVAKEADIVARPYTVVGTGRGGVETTERASEAELEATKTKVAGRRGVGKVVVEKVSAITMAVDDLAGRGMFAHLGRLGDTEYTAADGQRRKGNFNVALQRNQQRIDQLSDQYGKNPEPHIAVRMTDALAERGRLKQERKVAVQAHTSDMMADAFEQLTDDPKSRIALGRSFARAARDPSANLRDMLRRLSFNHLMDQGGALAVMSDSGAFEWAFSQVMRRGGVEEYNGLTVPELAKVVGGHDLDVELEPVEDAEALLDEMDQERGWRAARGGRASLSVYVDAQEANQELDDEILTLRDGSEGGWVVPKSEAFRGVPTSCGSGGTRSSAIWRRRIRRRPPRSSGGTRAAWRRP